MPTCTTYNFFSLQYMSQVDCDVSPCHRVAGELIAFLPRHTSFVIGHTHACSSSNNLCKNVEVLPLPPLLQAMKMDEDFELAASGARGDVALRMPPTPGQRQTLPNPVAHPPDDRQAEPSGASLLPAAASGANPNPNYHPGGSAGGDPLAVSGPRGLGARSGPLVSNPSRPAGGPGRPGIATSMPAAVARGGADGAMAGGAERRRDARSAEALGAPDPYPCPSYQLHPSGQQGWLLAA